MMARHRLHDAQVTPYEQTLRMLWEVWDPHRRKVQRVLRIGDNAATGLFDFSRQVQSAQYQCHQLVEQLHGLTPPMIALQAHHYFLETMENCRDSLGILGEKYEYVEDVEGQDAENMLAILHMTREAFNATCYASWSSFGQEADDLWPDLTVDGPHGRAFSRESRSSTVVVALGIISLALLGLWSMQALSS